MNVFTPLWLLWGVIFGVFETLALVEAHTRRGLGGGTLSATIWRFVDWKSGWGHRVARVVTMLGFVVLFTHLFFQVP